MRQANVQRPLKSLAPRPYPRPSTSRHAFRHDTRFQGSSGSRGEHGRDFRQIGGSSASERFLKNIWQSFFVTLFCQPPSHYGGSAITTADSADQRPWQFWNSQTPGLLPGSQPG